MIYYSEVTDELYIVTAHNNSFIYYHPTYGGGFISKQQLRNNLIEIGRL